MQSYFYVNYNSSRVVNASVVVNVGVVVNVVLCKVNLPCFFLGRPKTLRW